MSWFQTGADNGGHAVLGTGGDAGSGFSSMLWQLLVADEIIPGTAPGYNTCKTVYSYHPLGRKMVELPLEKAFSQPRTITFSDPRVTIADELVRRYQKEWARIGGLGGNTIIFRVAVLSRIYGVGSLLCGTRDQDPNTPLELDTLHKQDLYFSMLDPLNTAGSLVLQQDPTAPDFLQPQQIWAAGKNLHRTRTAVLIHEQPIWIEWTDSAFGFIGRSVYQRALFPMRSYILSMVADNEIQRKLMLLIAKMKAPGSVLDKVALNMFGVRRRQLKDSATGNVLSIGENESIEAINLEHTDKGGTYSRNNIIRNIAAASGMPAILLLDERIADGFGEGKEDAKEIGIYIDGIRQSLQGAFNFMDNIVQRRAWNPEWYKTYVQSTYPEYKSVSYDAALYQWTDAFEASWPSLYQPTEAEQLESECKKVDEAIKVYEALSQDVDPENKAALMAWLQDIVHDTKLFSRTDIELDPDSLIEWSRERQAQQDQMAQQLANNRQDEPPGERQDELRFPKVVPAWGRKVAER